MSKGIATGFGALPVRGPRRRVVVTGIGCVSPLGINAASTWEGLIANRSAGKSIDGLPYFHPPYVSAERRTAVNAALPCRVACPVTTPEAAMTRARSSSGKKQQLLDPFAPSSSQPRYTRFALHAAAEAVADSKLQIAESSDAIVGAYTPERVGVNVGVGMTPLHDVGDVAQLLYDEAASPSVRYNRVSPFFVPKILGNMVSGAVSIQHRLRGPNLSTISACATGAHCIGDACRLIQHGHVDAMVAGATEAAVTGVGLAGFARMRALSTSYNDTPESASRPFDSHRDGFVMGEGAGVLVLEALDAALERGAPIYAEVRGYGASGDGNHITTPREDGLGAIAAVKAALRDGGVEESQIGYANAHATSTPVGDGIELQALTTIFGTERRRASSPLRVSSSKGALGHLLGAAGAVEGIATALAVKHRMCPGTVNLTSPIEHDTTTVRLLTKAEALPELKAAVCLSFGFGGTNAAVVYTAVE